MQIRLAATAAILALSTSANADLILMLDDNNGNIVIVEDGSASDTEAAAGIVSYSGALGNFFISVSTGIAYPVIGGPLDPVLHLNSVDVSMGAGALTVALTATDFAASLGTAMFNLGFGGYTDGTIDLDAYLDSTNTAFGTGTLLGSMDSGSGAGFGGNLGGTVDIDNIPYSMSLFATITHDGQGIGTSSFDADLRVPEPGTFALFGMGLMLLGFRRKLWPAHQQ